MWRLLDNDRTTQKVTESFSVNATTFNELRVAMATHCTLNPIDMRGWVRQQLLCDDRRALQVIALLLQCPEVRSFRRGQTSNI